MFTKAREDTLLLEIIFLPLYKLEKGGNPYPGYSGISQQVSGGIHLIISLSR
jgi:hypothetical protein